MTKTEIIKPQSQRFVAGVPRKNSRFDPIRFCYDTHCRFQHIPCFSMWQPCVGIAFVDWMLHNLLWCILGTQARTRGRARSVQAPPARSLAPRAPLYASREKRLRLHTTTSTTQAFHSQFWDYQHRPLLTYTNSPSLSNRTATALGTPGARTAPARAALGTPGERWTPARAAQMSKASHHSWTATGPRECNTFSGPA